MGQQSSAAEAPQAELAEGADSSDEPAESSDTATTIYEAAETGQIVALRRLILGGANIDAEVTGPLGSKTPLYIAARRSHLPVVLLLLREGARLDHEAYERSKWAKMMLARTAKSFAPIDLDPFVNPDKYDHSVRLEAARLWDETFRSIGFAVIKGHGIASDILSDLRRAAKQFFASPDAYKNKFARGVCGRSGFSPYSPNGPSPGEPLEGYTFLRDRERAWDIPSEHPKCLAGAGERCAYEIERVMHAIHRIAAMALGLDISFFEEYYMIPASVFVISHYLPQSKLRLEPGKLRYRAHSDYTGFTILLQDEQDHVGQNGGLEIDINDSWVPVQPQKDCLVVNIGDLFENWTNNRWKSTRHRVTSPPKGSKEAERSRLTAMMFTGPNIHCTIAPVYTCVDEEHPAMFEPVQAATHLAQMHIQQSVYGAKLHAPHDDV
eukprot:TRINITY_DN28215_c0_g2_i1.p1 TRINITY_DN28215_c0_g2~~TRINITY_DN28215_c0_g2_i1.p1  ORF type:complete len:437 (+),score=66.12 TRINITY_DN28215_c0_g2_i1:50-1360(+)